MSFRRLIFALVCGLFVGVWEVGLRTFLPLPWSLFQPTITIMCLGLLLGWELDLLIFGLTVGLVHDLFGLRTSFLVLGLPLMLFGLRFLAKNVMTNRSVYGVIALVLVGRFGYWIWTSLALLVIRWLWQGRGFVASWGEVWRMLGWDIAFVVVYFFVSSIFTRFVFRRTSTSSGYAP